MDTNGRDVNNASHRTDDDIASSWKQFAIGLMTATGEASPSRDPATSDSPEKLEDSDAVRFLQNAGLGGGKIDAVSFEALKIFLSENPGSRVPRTLPVPISSSAPTAQQKNLIGEDLGKEVDSVPPLSEVRTNNTIRRATSEVTFSRVNDYRDSATASLAEDTQAATAGAISADVSKMREKLILEQLEAQMTMILGIHDRLDELTRAVERISNQSGPPQPSAPTDQAQVTRRIVSSVTRIVPPPNRQPGQPVQPVRRMQARAAAPPQGAAAGEPRRQDVFAFPFRRMARPVMEFPARIQNSRAAKLWKVFWALLRRDVRWDGGPLFKILLLVGMFAAKTMSRKGSTDGFWSASHKLRLVLTLMLVGFMIQSGFLVFLYHFFITGRYPQRVYAGEDIDVNREPQPARPPPRPRNNANVAARLENTLLGGGIPRADAREGGFLSFATDFVVLLGSFVLSILPMWKPNVLPNIIPQPPDLNEDAANNEGGNDNGPDNAEEDFDEVVFED